MTLKACPFCGSEATPITIDSFWKLECNKCAMQSGIFKTKEAAITAWNTRPREVELLSIMHPSIFYTGEFIVLLSQTSRRLVMFDNKTSNYFSFYWFYWIGAFDAGNSGGHRL